MTLFGAATESATYVLLAPSLAWAVLNAALTPGSSWKRWTLGASYGLFLLTQMASWFPGAAARVQTLGTQPFAALLFLAVMLTGWRKRAKKKTQPRRPAMGLGWDLQASSL
jgi:hypothetical protein